MSPANIIKLKNDSFNFLFGGIIKTGLQIISEALTVYSGSMAVVSGTNSAIPTSILMVSRLFNL
jgi:hypothetical protein